VAATMNEIETVRGFLGTLEASDVDRALTYVSPDVVYQNIPLSPARGLSEFEKQMRMLVKLVDRFEARIHHIAADGNFVLTERTDVLQRGGLRLAVWVCGTFEVRDGRIALWRDYFDWAAVSLGFLRNLPRMAIHPFAKRLRAPKASVRPVVRS
jgi:limonene-1,2-epoxide hydrolase